MNHLNPGAFCQSIHRASNHPLAGLQHPPSDPLASDLRHEAECKDSISARKLQKADREKLRRDRLNEQFVELGNVLDPDRPKNCKATILADTIQVLKDVTAQVNKLKAEHSVLTEESQELTQEKNDLREEKASLKSDIENLNAQYQQRLRSVFPWAAMDHSYVMGPPSYPMPMPVPIPTGPIPIHPPMQPYPYYGNQNSGVIPNPCSPFIPYVTPNTVIEPQPSYYISPSAQPVSRSHISGKQDSKSKSSVHQEGSGVGGSEDSNEVATDLELKTPGSVGDQDTLSGHTSNKKSSRKRSSNMEGSSSSRCSSSQSVHDSSLNSVADGGSGVKGKKE